MRKLLKSISISFGFFALILCGFLLCSCCSPKPCKATITFEGADARLGLNSYAYDVKFSDNTKVTFDVPKGYDSSVIKGYISGVEIPYEVQYDDKQTLEEGYEYTVDKKITFQIENVKRNFELTIDLTQMQKLQFEVTLNNGMNNFQALIIDKELTENFMTKLDESDVINTVNFVNGKASIEYGNYVVFMHNKSVSKVNYNAIYSNVNHYTLDINKANIGSINYSYYNRAKKGNTDYTFNSNPNTALYYFGEIKEDIKLYSQIPNYIEDKGFVINRAPNSFYLFSNIAEYDSDLLTMEMYTSCNLTYNSSNANMDKIDGKTVLKVDKSARYKDRYDIHKIYLGNDLQSGVLLDDESRKGLNKDLYVVLTTTLDIQSFNFYLLNDEFERTFNSYRVNVQSDLTDKGKYYITFSKEDLDKFSLTRDYVSSNGSIHEFKTGLAILYPEVDYSYFSSVKGKTYLRIYKNIVINSDNLDITTNDIFVNLYLKDGDNIKYGLNDNHFWPNSVTKTDCVYFKLSDIFDWSETEKRYYYKENLYFEIRGEKYKNFKSPTINYFTVHTDDENLTIDSPVRIEDYKTYNGYKDFKISSLIFKNLGEHTLTVRATMREPYKEPVTLDFSQLQLPSIYTQGLFITSNSLFNDRNDFSFINGGLKDNFNGLKFSMTRDLYYFSNCADSDFDIEVRLDPNDSSTCISSSQNFCDIMGRKITMEINGEPYAIKVIKQDTIFNLLENGKMWVVKKGS